MTDHSSVLIRPATGDDLATVLRLVRGLAEYEKLVDKCTVTEPLLREALFGNRPMGEAVLAIVDDQAAGLAVYYATFSTFTGRGGLFLEDLFVEPKFRGQGIGKRLLAHVGAIGVERGCRRMEWIALKWNKLAIDFYRAQGAISQDEWTTFRLSDDALERLAAVEG